MNGHQYLKKILEMDISRFHNTLAELYNSDQKISDVIDNMVQIDTEIPHSACGEWWEKLKPSYVYKRPNIKFVIHNEKVNYIEVKANI